MNYMIPGLFGVESFSAVAVTTLNMQLPETVKILGVTFLVNKSTILVALSPLVYLSLVFIYWLYTRKRLVKKNPARALVPQANYRTDYHLDPDEPAYFYDLSQKETATDENMDFWSLEPAVKYTRPTIDKDKWANGGEPQQPDQASLLADLR